MHITVNAHPTYCYTGGKAFDPAKPTVVFIHGVLNDHSVWILQSRYFAHHGYNVLAIDLPGHCKSAGPPPDSVEAAGRWVIALLDAAGVQQAALVGHSLGSLIALEAAAQAPERVSHLAMVGTAFPMKVSPALLDAALNQPLKGIDMVNTFSHSTLCPPPSALGPGTWLYGSSRALMRRVQTSNPQVNLFHHGFGLCDRYLRGNDAVVQVFAESVATVFIVGSGDQMTPPKAAQSLVDGFKGKAKLIRVNAGHSLMTEAPEEVLAALRGFIGP
jgi:pimeloyl-ACP methyl ester carboxylesterase